MAVTNKGSYPFYSSWRPRRNFSAGNFGALVRDPWWVEGANADGEAMWKDWNLPAYVAPTERVRYVDTASTAGGDGTVDTTSGANRAYPTLAAAITAETATVAKSDLVAANVYLTIYCKGSSADTSEPVIDGFRTSPIHYVQVVVLAANRHDGKWNSSKYRIVNSAYWGIIQVLTPHCRFIGLQLENQKTGAGGGTPGDGIHIQTPYHNGEIIVDSCVLRYTGDYTNQLPRGVNNNDVTGLGLKLTVANCVIYDFQYNLYLRTFGAERILAYNNTLLDSTSENFVYLLYGISALVRMYNNIVQGTQTNYYNSGSSGATLQTGNNISEDTSSPDTSFRSKVVTFVNEAGNDFHLDPSDTVAKSLGADLDSDSYYPITLDIDGDTRSATAPSIGADEPAATTKSVTDTPTAVITESRTLAASSSRTDTPTVVITESKSLASSLSRADAPAAAITDTSALLRQSSQSDAPTAAISDASNLVAVVSRTDAPAVSLTEAKTLVASSSRADTPTAVITESRTLAASSSQADTPTAVISETSANAVSSSRTDSPTVGITDTVAVLNIFSASDTPSAAISETSSNLSALSRADAPAAAITESRALAASSSRTDTLDVSIGEEIDTPDGPDVIDSVSVSISDVAAITAIGFTVSDTPTAVITESRTIAVSSSRSDTLDVTTPETRGLLAAFTRTDAPAVAVSDAAVPGVSLSRSDTATVAVADARSLAAASARTDSLETTIVDSRGILAVLSRSDTLAISDSESAAIAVTAAILAADSLGILISDLKSITADLVRSDSLIVSHGGTAAVSGTIAADDTLAAAVDEADSIFRRGGEPAPSSRTVTIRGIIRVDRVPAAPPAVTPPEEDRTGEIPAAPRSAAAGSRGGFSRPDGGDGLNLAISDAAVLVIT